MAILPLSVTAGPTEPGCIVDLGKRRGNDYLIISFCNLS